MKKIRNIDLSICTHEQKVAYNFCFRYYDVFLAQKDDRIEVIKKLLLPLKHNKNIDFKTVSGYVLRNIERYAAGEKHIFSSYQEIGNFFK